MKQLALLKDQPKAYGGELLKTRKGRAQPRPIDTRNTMHLVLRSSKARGNWSFRKPGNARRIEVIAAKFAHKYGVKILSSANVGNHLHFHIKLGTRFGYKPFIRAITGAIAMAVTGVSRWSRSPNALKFWDYRPYTRIVRSLRAFLNMRDYIRINQLEGFGYERGQAAWMVKRTGSG